MRRVDNANQTAGTTTNFNNYQFDFGNGLGKGLSNAPLKDQQKQSGPGWSPWTASQAAPKAAASSQSGSSGWANAAGWSGQQTKPSGGGGLGSGYSSSSSQTWGSSTTSTQTGWAGYQPMTQGLAKPAAAAATTATTATGLGIGGGVRSNAASMKSSAKLAVAGIAGIAQSQAKGDDVFGDLLGATLNRSNAPMNSKNMPSKPSSFSMGNFDSSLPKTEVPPVQKTPMAKMGRSTSTPPESVAHRQTANSAERDPFPPFSASSSVTYEDDVFSFPSQGPPSANAAPPPMSRSSFDDPFGFSGSSSSIGSSTTSDPFAFGGSAKPVPPTRAPPPPKSTPVGDPFDVFSVKASPAVGRKPVDPLESLLSKSTPPPSKAPVQDDGWGVFGGGGSGGSSGGNEPTTTELEGLPSPPSGVTAASATVKGSEFYKNGQFPDAIKWLSWSLELLKSNPDKNLMEEVLTCRVSCFKEIGEMKKAVADCSKAIALQPTSVTLLMLRSNLYESMEKYKLGVADLKLVMKLDNGHLKARQSLTRLERMAAQ